MRRQDWPQEVNGQRVLGNFKPSPVDRTERPLSYQKRRDGNDPNHLALIRRLSCLICQERDGVDPHHLKTGPARVERAFGRRATDQWCISLCRAHHDDLEKHPSSYEPEWFDSFGYTPQVLYYIPLRLWRESRLIKPAGFDAALGRAQRIIDGYKLEAIQVLGTRCRQRKQTQ